MAKSKPRSGNETRRVGPIDLHVGIRVRQRRVLLGMTQTDLADTMDLSFQQVQKYEKGTNRIGASRLQHISTVLSVPVAFFFEDAPATPGASPGLSESASSNYVVNFLSSSEGIQLNKAFVRIRDPKLRRRIIDLVRAVAGDDRS